MRGGFRERHNAIALAFAQAHRETMRRGIHVIEVELLCFSVTDAGSLESFHQRAIAQANGCRNVRSFDQLSDL
jgi:hypothetical protein